jgi:glutathione-specific gamma-glutamylcyclotransferase
MPTSPPIFFDDDGDTWFFAYGSLMWDPCFSFTECQPGLLRGFHRSFCVRSVSYRGTPEAPGLVLGLDRGGACQGRAFRIALGDREAAARSITEREMDRDIYVCRKLPVRVPAGRVLAHALVVHRSSELYLGRLPAAEIAHRIARAHGKRGANLAYLAETVAHLDALGIKDGPMHALLRATNGLAADDSTAEV